MVENRLQEVAESNQETFSNDQFVFIIRNNPVMMEAINVITLLGKTKKVILRAKGDSIPNAVAIANIITEKMLKGNSQIQKISVDTEGKAGIGKMVSTIEIVLLKN